ncbi:MAG: histidine kinase N-terminal 7TM domain-containing protein, partial [Chloroflexota bacterium]
MNPENLIPFLVMTGSALTTAQLARHAWRERSSPDEIEFALLMLCATIYAGAAACEYLVPSPQAKILCSQVAYAGLVNLPPLWLLYALRHSHSSAWVTRRRVAILWIMPVIILVLAATNAWHGLIWPSITPINDRPGARLVYEHGPGILALVLYAYPLLLTGSVLLVRAAWKAPRMFGWQAGLMVAAALFPWLGNLLYLLKLNPWPGLDLTPPAFMFAGLLITFNASRYHVFDIAPVAREAVFAGMGDAVLVLDNQHRLVDLNQAAQRWTGLSQKDIGREIAHILTPQHLSGQITELTLHQGDEPAIFDLSFSPLQDARGRPRGRVALLHDIRRERQLLEAEHRRNAQLTALQSIGQAVVASLELEQLFATVVKVLHDTFDYPYVTIYRLQNGSLHLGAQVGSPDEQVIATIPVGRSVCGRAARTRQAQLVVDINQDPDYLRTAPDVQSEICVPLMQKQTVLGVLDVETCSPRRLDETDLEQLNMFATQVVIAINNARVFQAERQQRQLAEALRAVGLALSESLDFEAVMDRLLDEIGKVIPYDAVTVLLVEDGSGTACVAGRRGSERIGARLGWRTMSLDFNLAATRNLARMIETGQPLIIRDVLSEPAWAGVSTTAQLRAWLGAPITVRGRVIGFLSLDKAEPGFYTPDHAQGLAAFTGQTAIAIENARAFTEMQRQSEKERLLLAATRDFTSGLDREAVLQAIVTHMVNGLGADGCTISRWDAAQDRLVTLLDYEVVPGAPVEPPGQVHPLESFPHTRAVLQQRTPLFISQADPQIDPAERALLPPFFPPSFLLLPL